MNERETHREEFVKGMRNAIHQNIIIWDGVNKIMKEDPTLTKKEAVIVYLYLEREKVFSRSD